MDTQFAQIDQQPDIIIATPGRLLHILVEMDRKLSHVKMAIFDEADQLFEMGFAEQLNEILGRLPDSKQVLLFSATLPSTVLEFAKVAHSLSSYSYSTVCICLGWIARSRSNST